MKTCDKCGKVVDDDRRVCDECAKLFGIKKYYDKPVDIDEEYPKDWFNEKKAPKILGGISVPMMFIASILLFSLDWWGTTPGYVLIFSILLWLHTAFSSFFPENVWSYTLFRHRHGYLKSFIKSHEQIEPSKRFYEVNIIFIYICFFVALTMFIFTVIFAIEPSIIYFLLNGTSESNQVPTTTNFYQNIIIP